MNSKVDIYNKLVVILNEEFELDANSISMDMNLYKDLGLDSIDAIDLIIRLQEIVGKKIDPETFKSVRTVDDMVNSIDLIVNTQIM
jgi:acyl carrier protein|tara:strand:+ start:50 stop:307 length:258 start_codon:yes stop_codon:yes gene_type:complete